MINRTDQEILDHLEFIKSRDWLGFESGDLINCLPFEYAKSYLKDGVTAEQWHPESRERDAILKRMLDYMPFAWDKANNCRGISAGRSMSHYMAWIWLLGDDLGNLLEYEYYGKANLVAICEKYGWDASQWDDGERTNG